MFLLSKRDSDLHRTAALASDQKALKNLVASCENNGFIY